MIRHRRGLRCRDPRHCEVRAVARCKSVDGERGIASVVPPVADDPDTILFVGGEDNDGNIVCHGRKICAGRQRPVDADERRDAVDMEPAVVGKSNAVSRWQKLRLEVCFKINAGYFANLSDDAQCSVDHPMLAGFQEHFRDSSISKSPPCPGHFHPVLSNLRRRPL